jgi:hypothetical protein
MIATPKNAINHQCQAKTDEKRSTCEKDLPIGYKKILHRDGSSRISGDRAINEPEVWKGSVDARKDVID